MFSQGLISEAEPPWVMDKRLITGIKAELVKDTEEGKMWKWKLKDRKSHQPANQRNQHIQTHGEGYGTCGQVGLCSCWSARSAIEENC